MDKTIFKTIHDLIVQDIANTQIDTTNEEEVKALQAKHLIKRICSSNAKDLIPDQNENNTL